MVFLKPFIEILCINQMLKNFSLLFCLIPALTLWSCSGGQSMNTTLEKNQMKDTTNMEKIETAIFGSGCFWCTEPLFSQLKGVISATSGYAGGTVENPSYEAVCTGSTGHAEVVQVKFDPKIISFKELLEVFWKVHDPTTLNRQGADVGTQYRSVIFYTNEAQKDTAEAYKQKLDASGAFDKPIVTQIAPFTNFYPAEDYHQDYYTRNGHAPYCQMVIKPKKEKFEKIFKDKLK